MAFINKLRNTSLNKVNKTYVAPDTGFGVITTSPGPGSVTFGGMQKSEFHAGASGSVAFVLAAGKGGSGSPRGGRCSGGGGGGGGAAVMLFPTLSLGQTVNYSVGSDGSPIGGGGECCEPSRAPSGTPSWVFFPGYYQVSGGQGASSAWGKWGNPGEPPCYNGRGGSGGSGVAYAATPDYWFSGPGGNGGNGGNTGSAGAPGATSAAQAAGGGIPTTNPGGAFIAIYPYG